MTTSVRAKSVRFDRDNTWVELVDGRVLGVPLAWFPRLLQGTSAECAKCRITSRGLHWESLDEDVSIAALLNGLGDLTMRCVPA